MAEQRLPTVGGDDGSWGTILNQFLEKEHYNTGSDNAANGMHKGVTIRAGTTSVAPLTFTTTSAALLTAPAAGTMEIDSSGLLYYTQTTGSGNRRRVMYYDDASAATGDVFYRDSGGNIVRLGIGSSNYVLTVNSGLPSWQPASSGTPGGSDGQVQYKSGSSFAGAAGISYQSGASPNTLITAQNSAHTPLTVRGAASQSVDLQQWQSSTPTTLAAIDSAGKLVFATDTNLYRSAAHTLATDDDLNIKGGKALKLDGSSSGTVTINTASTAGTWALTLPTSDGNANQFLQTDGGGITSWQDVVTLSWTEVTGTSQTAAINSGYITNNAGLVTVTLPTTAALGDMIRIVGKGAGGWKLAQNASQKIYFGNVSTTTGTGGYLQYVNARDAVTVVCVTANNDWEVIAAQGNITYA